MSEIQSVDYFKAIASVAMKSLGLGSSLTKELLVLATKEPLDVVLSTLLPSHFNAEYAYELVYAKYAELCDYEYSPPRGTNYVAPKGGRQYGRPPCLLVLP